MPNNLRNLLLIFFLVLVITLPFIGQQIHIDDHLFLYSANSINKNILLPYHFYFLTVEESIKGGFEGFTNPPLNSYFIAAITRFFGEKPIVLHSFFIVFAAFGAFSLYLLCKLFVKNTFLATCTAITTPVFMLQSHSLMPDIMLLGLWCQAVYCYIKGLNENNKKLLLLSSIFTSLALLTRYNGLLLIPLLFIYALLKKHNFSTFRVYLLIPLCIFILWCLHNVFFYGRIHILTPIIVSQSFFMKLSSILPRVILYFIYIGSLMLFPVCFMILFLLKENYCKKKYSCAILILFLLSACYLFFCGDLIIDIIFYSFTTSFCILFFIWLVKGLQASKNNGDEFYKYTDDLFLLIWIIILIIFHSSAYFISPKFLVLIIPAVIFLLFRMLERKYINLIPYSKNIILICFTLGFLICESDYSQSVFDSKEFSRIIKYYSRQFKKTVWFTTDDRNWGNSIPYEFNAVYNKHDFKEGDLILGTPSFYKKNLTKKNLGAVQKTFLYYKPPLFKVLDTENNIYLYYDGYGKNLPYSVNSNKFTAAIIWEIVPVPILDPKPNLSSVYRCPKCRKKLKIYLANDGNKYCKNCYFKNKKVKRPKKPSIFFLK